MAYPTASNDEDNLLKLCELVFDDFIQPLTDAKLTSKRAFLSIINDKTSLRNWLSSRMCYADNTPIPNEERLEFVKYVKDYCSNNSISSSESILQTLAVGGGITTCTDNIINLDLKRIEFKPTVNSTFDRSRDKSELESSQQLILADHSNLQDASPEQDNVCVGSITTTIQKVPTAEDVLNYPTPKFENGQIIYFVNPCPKQNAESILSDGSFNCCLFDFKVNDWSSKPKATLEGWSSNDEVWKEENPELARTVQCPVPVDFELKIDAFATEIYRRAGYVFPYLIPEDTCLQLCNQLLDRKDLVELDAYYQRFKAHVWSPNLKDNHFSDVTKFLAYKVHNKFTHKATVLTNYKCYPLSARQLSKLKKELKNAPISSSAAASSSNSQNSSNSNEDTDSNQINLASESEESDSDDHDLPDSRSLSRKDASLSEDMKIVLQLEEKEQQGPTKKPLKQKFYKKFWYDDITRVKIHEIYERYLAVTKLQNETHRETKEENRTHRAAEKRNASKSTSGKQAVKKPKN